MANAICADMWRIRYNIEYLKEKYNTCHIQTKAVTTNYLYFQFTEYVR